MIGSIIGAGFSREDGSFSAMLEGAQTNASGAARSPHHGPQLTVSASSLSFGNVAMNTATTQSLALTSSGTTPVTISSASIAGSPFSIVAQGFPVTLDPGDSLTLQVKFDPTTTGAASGKLTLKSNSTSGSTAVVTLSGTGTGAPAAHEVTLSWNAPQDSSDSVAGYNIYRSPSNGSFVRLNASPDTALSYMDSTVVSGSSYSYEVTSVDSNGVESDPSSPFTVTIP